MISVLKRALKLTLLASALSFMVISHSAFPEPAELENVCELDIPAGDLAKTLVLLGIQCRLPVVAPYDMVEGYSSSPVVGTMTIQHAAEKLMRRTPFEVRLQQNPVRQLTIQRRQPTRSTASKPEVDEHSSEARSEIQEVVVTGIRASLEQSLRIKRESIALVDAISAEDIGKFPDSNLAESIQRISGAAISRDNGEGSRVTVRGFTGNYNLVTLNGRILPVVAAPTDRPEDSRAFEFSHLAAPNFSRVEIRKSSGPNQALGGIGATVNIETYKPFSLDSKHNYVAVKVLNDESHSQGISPEVSAVLSRAGERFGATLSASYQERTSGLARAEVDSWTTQPWVESGQQGAVQTHAVPCAEIGGDPLVDRCVRIENPPNVDQLYSMPADLSYIVGERRSKRLNAILALQYQANDKLRLGLDYALFKNTREVDASQMLFRLTGNRSLLTFDSAEVRTPQYLAETYFDEDAASAIALNFATLLRNRSDLTRSLGFKANWDITEDWTVTLDGHSATSVSDPEKGGYGSWANIHFGANVVSSQQVDWSGDLPLTQITIDDSLLEGYGSADGQFTADDIGTQVAFNRYSFQQSDIDQLRLDSDWSHSVVTFTAGLEYAVSENTTRFSEKTVVLGDWGVTDADIAPEGLFTELNYAAAFAGYKSSDMYQGGYRADAGPLLAWAQNNYGDQFGDGFHYNDNFALNRSVREQTLASYFTGSWSSEYLQLSAGTRLFQTKVRTSAFVNKPLQIAWYDNGDFSPVFDTSKVQEVQTNQYSDFLPSAVLRYEPVDGAVFRLSYAESIARAEYAELSPEYFDLNVTGVTEPGVTNAFARQGNPDLQPLKSANIDLAFEWYFGSSNYLSLGFFDKKIRNFIGFRPSLGSVYDLRDASSGERAQTAREAIRAQADFDGTITDTDLFNQIAAVENNDFNPDGADDTYYGNEYDIFPNENDPVFQFSTLRPDNNRTANVWGWEYAIQYFPGSSGLGILANYTVVNGDIGYQPDAIASSAQFALLGLSDTANVIALWERDSYQIRLAYNWRETYLASLASEPVFVEEYSQLDAMLQYQFSDRFSVSLEAFNILESDFRSHGRSKRQLVRFEQLRSRYLIGFRYQF